MGSRCQSASCWLICNNRLITAFHPSFPLHPAEQGSRPALLAHSSPAAYHQQPMRSMFSLGEDPAQPSPVGPRGSTTQGCTHAESDMESSETSSSSSARPYLLPAAPQQKGHEPMLYGDKQKGNGRIWRWMHPFGFWLPAVKRLVVFSGVPQQGLRWPFKEKVMGNIGTDSQI